MPTHRMREILFMEGWEHDKISALTEDQALEAIKNLEEKPEICFTGFTDYEERDFEKVAFDDGLVVVSQVTSKLTFLCLGEAPGPVKMKKARDQLAHIFDSPEEFMKMVKEETIMTLAKEVRDRQEKAFPRKGSRKARSWMFI